jgi:hypothetical protein
MARVKSGAFKARKSIPKDVRDEYQALLLPAVKNHTEDGDTSLE